MSEAYPLSWPPGWPRTAEAHKIDGRHHFRRPTSSRASPYWTLADARNALMRELRLLDAGNIVLSSNFPLDREGRMVERSKRPIDQGIAIYFTLADGAPKAMARDCYLRIEENMRSLTLTIEAMRTIDRHGGSFMMAQAFKGFEALPAPGQHARRPWWQVLGCTATASPAEIERAYRAAARAAHPDLGGSEPAMQEVNAARDEALATRST